MISSLTKTGRPVGCYLVSLGANTLEAALCIYTVTSAAQQRVPLTLIDVWQQKNTHKYSKHTDTSRDFSFQLGQPKSSKIKNCISGWDVSFSWLWYIFAGQNSPLINFDKQNSETLQRR